MTSGIFGDTAAVLAASFNSPTQLSILPTAALAAPSAVSDDIASAAAAAPAAAPSINNQPDPNKSVLPGIVVPATFKLVFLTVVGITIAAAVVQIVFAVALEHPTHETDSIFETMGFAWKSGLGVIFGLMGGKVIQ
jgi:hypothetical protein